MEGRKEYIAEFTLGAQTVTASDDSGEVVKTMPVPAFDKQELEAVLARFTGKQMQLPPMYSAIKINGKKLYQLARQGVEVNAPHVRLRSISWSFCIIRQTEIYRARGLLQGHLYPRSGRGPGDGAGNLRYDELFAAHAGGAYTIDKACTLQEIAENPEACAAEPLTAVAELPKLKVNALSGGAHHQRCTHHGGADCRRQIRSAGAGG